MIFWLQVGSNKFPILGEIVLKVRTSQAAAERAWSIYEFILTKRRNRLAPPKFTKLVQLYMNVEIAEKENDLLGVMMVLEEDVGDSDGELPNAAAGFV